MWRSRVRLGVAGAVGVMAFLAALVGASGLFGGGSTGSLVALLIAILVFLVFLVIPRRPSLTEPHLALPPAAVPERPPDFGFLKWWEFRRALNRAREMTREEARAEILDGMIGRKGASFSMLRVLRRLEAREREVHERFGLMKGPPPATSPQTAAQPTLVIMPPARPHRLGFWDHLWYNRDYERDVLSRTLADLEAETNRRAIDLLKKSVIANDAWALGRLTTEKRSFTRMGTAKHLLDRATAIQAIEHARGLPDPFDAHAFVLSRLDSRRRELDRKYGLNAGSPAADSQR